MGWPPLGTKKKGADLLLPPPPPGEEAAATCTCLSVHTIVEHPNQEGDTLLNLVALIGLTAESVHGRDIQSIITDH